MNNGIQLRLSDLIYAIIRRRLQIILLTLAGIIIGFVITGIYYLQGVMNRNYEVTCSIAVTAQNDRGRFSESSTYPSYNDLKMSVDMVDSVSYILKSERTLKNVIAKQKLVGISPSGISGHLRIRQYNQTPIIEMTLSWRSADEGIKIMNGILEEAGSVLTDTMRIGAVTTLNEPTSRYLVGGMNLQLWLYTASIGMLAGIGLAILELMVKPTLLNLKDVETQFGMETFGVIPKDDAYFKKQGTLPAVYKDPANRVYQEFTAAAHIVVNRLASVKGPKCLYVTSTEKNEGKTSVAAHLAVHLAEMEKRVLLIDMNATNPTIGSLFFEYPDYGHSLNALYRGEITEREAVSQVSGMLDVIYTILEHTPLAVDSAVTDLIKNLAGDYDYVIMDAGAVGKEAEVLSLNQIANMALFVIGYDMARTQDIREALDTLQKSGVKILGCVVNGEQQIAPIKKRTAVKKQSGKKKKDGKIDLDELTARDESERPVKKPAEEGIPARREILDEMNMPVERKTITDQEAVDALIKIGLEGSWDEDEM